MLGERPSSLTELHAQKRQVNDAASHPGCLLRSIPRMCFSRTSAALVAVFSPPESDVSCSRTARRQQRLLPLRGAEGNHLLGGGHAHLPERVPASFPHRALPRAAAAQHRLPATEGAVFPAGEEEKRSPAGVSCSEIEP